MVCYSGLGLGFYSSSNFTLLTISASAIYLSQFSIAPINAATSSASVSGILQVYYSAPLLFVFLSLYDWSFAEIF